MTDTGALAQRMDAEALVARLDSLARRGMDHWHIPGLAFALVLPGAAPLLRTYGTRDTQAAAPVTADTQFHTCSLTKSLTAAGLLLLLEQRQIASTTRVRDVLPAFRLPDAVVTEQVTLRDLLCHASGLPRHDRIWTPGDLSMPQMLERLRHLALSAGLRERFQYNNLGYVVLAAVVEALAGTAWEAYTRATLLAPLGMQDCGFSPAALQAAADHAHPHLRDGEAIRRGGRVWPAPGPAGGLNASIAAMARWLQFLLGGALPGVPLERSRKVLADMLTPWMYSGTSSHPELGAGHYGLGLACERYRGLRVASHTGSMPGWGALLSFLPELQAGIVVLTNRDATPVPNMLAFALADAMGGLAPVDWFTRFAALRAKALEEEAAQREADARLPSAVLAARSGDYAGAFTHPAYGTFVLAASGDGIVWDWRGLRGTLQPRAHEQFLLHESEPARHAEPFPGTFLHDRQGRLDRLAITLEPEVPEIVFQRVGKIGI